MRRILRIGKSVKARRARVKEICELPVNAMGVDLKAELIEALIPIGLWRVKELLEEEVKQIAGERYKRSGLAEYDRWGKQGGSVYKECLFFLLKE
jgi:hypothetical protein